MSDSKIKIKDLATELKMDAKELLQELQSMGFNVKSAQGSIPMEEVSGVRDRVAENRQRKADRKDDQPTVIVRRRRVKDEAPAEEQPVAETRAEAAPEKAPEPAAPVETPAARVISVPEPEKAPEAKPEPVKAEPKAEKTPEPVAPVETPAARVVAAPEAEKAPEAKPEPVKNEAKAEPRTEAKRETRVEKATPQTARVVAPAGARVISRPDTTPTARIIRPAQAAAPVTKTEAKAEPKPEKALHEIADESCAQRRGRASQPAPQRRDHERGIGRKAQNAEVHEEAQRLAVRVVGVGRKRRARLLDIAREIKGRAQAEGVRPAAEDGPLGKEPQRLAPDGHAARAETVLRPAVQYLRELPEHARARRREIYEPQAQYAESRKDPEHRHSRAPMPGVVNIIRNTYERAAQKADEAGLGFYEQQHAETGRSGQEQESCAPGL